MEGGEQNQPKQRKLYNLLHPIVTSQTTARQHCERGKFWKLATALMLLCGWKGIFPVYDYYSKRSFQFVSPEETGSILMDASTELNVVSIASIFGLRKFSLLVSLFPRGSAAAYNSFYRNRFLSQCIQLLLFSTIFIPAGCCIHLYVRYLKSELFLQPCGSYWSKEKFCI